MSIRAERVDIATRDGHGLMGSIYAESRSWPNRHHKPSAPLSLTVRDSRIEAAGGGSGGGCAKWNRTSTKCGGVFAYHKASGTVDIDVEDSRVEAKDGAYGIWVEHGEWINPAGRTQGDDVYDLAWVGHDLNVAIDIVDSEIVSTREHAVFIERREGSKGKNMITVKNSTVKAMKDGSFAIYAEGDTDIFIKDNGSIEGPVTARSHLNAWVGGDQVIRNGEIIRTMGSAGAYDTTVSAAGDGDSYNLDRDRRYAARTALYESLPGLLLRLDGGAPIRRPEEPVWTRLGFGAGRGEARRSPAGASYDFDRIDAEAGVSRTWGNGWSGSTWLRRVHGEVKVDAPTGGSEVGLHGVGAGVAAHWSRDGGLEFSGEFSWTDFDMDADSARRGRLVRDVGAKLLQGRLAARYRLEQEGGLTLSPRGWLWHAEAEIDDFTDTVGARVAYADESCSAVGWGCWRSWCSRRPRCTARWTWRACSGARRRRSGCRGSGWCRSRSARACWPGSAGAGRGSGWCCAADCGWPTRAAGTRKSSRRSRSADNSKLHRREADASLRTSGERLLPVVW